MKKREIASIVFLFGLLILYSIGNSFEQNQSSNSIPKQDYLKQFAEFSQLLIIPNTLKAGQTYEVYGQIKNFLTGEAISNTTISFRIFPPSIDSAIPFNTTTTDINGNFKIQFSAPNQPSFYYLSAYLTGNKDYYPTDSNPLPFVVFP